MKNKALFDEEKFAKHLEFGGPLGCLLLMIFSHFITLYLFICNEFYSGSLFLPFRNENFFNKFIEHIKDKAMPNKQANTIYLVFIFTQGFLGLVLPGLKVKGLPIPHENNKQLIYNCNGI